MRSPEILKQFAGFNRIINGNFDYWQRGESFSSPANLAYTTDRFKIYNSDSIRFNIVKSADVPTLAQCGAVINQSINLDCAVAQASLGTGSYAILEHNIEGFNINSLYGKDVTLSFWVKANKIGKYSVGLRNGANTRSYPMEYEIFTSDTWERKTLTFEIDNTVGTWEYGANIGLRARFNLAIGTDMQTSTLDEWNGSNGFASSNQVNFVDSTSNTIKFSQIMMHEGKEALDSYVWAGGDYANEFRLCQRYFWTSYANSVSPGSITNTGMLTSIAISNMSTWYEQMFPVEMCRVPSMVFYNSVTGSNTRWRWHIGGANAVITTTVISKKNAVVNIASVTSENRFYGHMTADAELT